MNTTAAAAGVGCRPPFTAAQWQELEHQALIFKYLMAGMPVPQELLLPIRRSFDAMAARFYQHPALSYYTHYGKKLDPEPGRCRRTDGKKWRCSKDAYPDSKYCERHMHRGRNRSRKPVETQTISQSQPQSSSTVPVTSLSPAATAAGSFQGLPMASIASSSQLHIDPASFAMGSKDFRYLHGMKPEVDEHSFFSEASGSSRSLGVDSSMENSWRLMPSNMPTYALREGSVVQSSYPQLQSLHDYDQVTISSVPKHQHQHQHSFFGSDFASMEPAKNETRSLRPFFDEWPKTRDSWSDLEEERSNRSAFSTTQLSMSTPMSSSDFDISNRSPSDE